MVRIKHRYLLLNILYPDKPNSPGQYQKSVATEDEVPWTVQFRRPASDELDVRMLLRMIRDGVSELFGDYGSGMTSSSLQVRYLSTATSTAIIRVARAHYRMVWAALSFVTRLPKPIDQPCVIQVVRVSGTIKKSEEEAIRRARLNIVRARKAGRPMDLNATGTSGSTRVAHDENEDIDMMNGIEDPDEPADFDDDDND